jgi:hypothetical protein
MSANERTGWRCQEISERHRDWGYNCPAVDLDFLVAEYNLGKPVALIEYKHFKARVPDTLHPTYRAITDLADRYGDKGLPFAVVFYWPSCWAFKVYPINSLALTWFSRGEMLTEREYVKRLYRMRGQVLTDHLAGRLKDELPEQVAA